MIIIRLFSGQRGFTCATVQDVFHGYIRQRGCLEVLWLKKDGHPAKSHLTEKEEVR